MVLTNWVVSPVRVPPASACRGMPAGASLARRLSLGHSLAAMMRPCPETRAQLTAATRLKPSRRKRTAGERGMRPLGDETRDGSMPIGFCVRLVAAGVARCLLRAPRRRGGAGCRSSSSTRASRSRWSSARRAGGGYDTYARLLARHFGDAHPRQSDRRGAEHERRRIQPRRRLHLFGRAEGRHRDRRDLPRRGAAAAARATRRCRTIRTSSSISAAPTATSMSATCAADAPVKTFKDVLDKRADHRRQQPGRHHLRPAAAAEQRARHEIPHRHRLSRQPRDHARARTRRGAGRLRHRLDRHRDHASGLVRQGHDHACWCSSAPKAIPISTSAACRARGDFARNDDDRQVIELVFSQGMFGRPVRAAAGRAGGSGRGAAQGIHGSAERQERCGPKPTR